MSACVKDIGKAFGKQLIHPEKNIHRSSFRIHLFLMIIIRSPSLNLQRLNSPPPKTSMAMDTQPLKMYLVWNMVIFQLTMLVYWRVGRMFRYDLIGGSHPIRNSQRIHHNGSRDSFEKIHPLASPFSKVRIPNLLFHDGFHEIFVYLPYVSTMGTQNLHF